MRRDHFQQLLAERVLVSDGAMGTLLQAQGALPSGLCPELLNLQRPELVQWVHQQYLSAGCDLIQTNTFGANRLKLANYGLSDQVSEINRRAAYLARQAASSGGWVAGDIGPVGQLIRPLGQLTFDEVCEVFYQQARALAAGEVDLLLIETMSDLHEAKAAVIGARAASSSLPIICSLTYSEDLRTLTGADPETVVTVLEALGVDAVGTNCGFGPERMGEILERQYRVSDRPLLVQPNAGLPRHQEGRTVFTLAPEEMASYVAGLIAAGANIVGGCCGTTPEHLRLIVEQARGYTPRPRQHPAFSKLAGATETIYISDQLPTQVIGERINPTARKRLAKALKDADLSVVADEAAAQVQAGAALVDINVGTRAPGIDEAALMPQAILAAQRVVGVPLSIDTASHEAMRSGLRVYRGKPLLNSANGDEEKLEQVTDLAREYGAAILGLTLDHSGIPATASERLKIARRIVDRALARGIRREDVYIDTLTLTAGASQELVAETLRAIRLVKEELGVRTALGVSNISHGLPNRAALNNTFLAMALAAGLDLPIINPDQEGVWPTIFTADLITNRDRHAARYLAKAAPAENPGAAKIVAAASEQPARERSSEERLVADILSGERGHLAQLTTALLGQGWPAMRIIDECVIPAMDTAGSKYDQRLFFLPQLLLAAEAAQETFQLLRPQLEQSSESKAGTVVLATVKGDIHDIGKSIVGLLLRNHGFQVIDLGKDVESSLIIQTASEAQADLIALSALMTTTMPEMAVIADGARERGMQVPILVGGAVVSGDYARSIGAHYAADATEAVRAAKSIIERRQSKCRD